MSARPFLPVIAMLGAVACGGHGADATHSDDVTDVEPHRHHIPYPAGGTTSTVAPESGPACASESDCAPNELCQSPEEASWNFCGPPGQSSCPPAHVGDSCGHCFRACSGETPCDAPMTCNGSYCISARHCMPLRAAPP